MSASEIFKDWGSSSNLQAQSMPSEAPVDIQQGPETNLLASNAVSTAVLEPISKPVKASMRELLAKHGVKVSATRTELPEKQEEKISNKTEPSDVFAEWNGKTPSQKHMESLTPEEFKTEFMNRLSTMDIGERTGFERFLFGKTAKDANPVQAFARGVRGELSETGMGARQRIQDVTGATPEDENKNQVMLDQIKQQQKTEYPNTTTAGKIAGTIAEFAPLAVTGTGAVPLLAEGAAYGVTRPQEQGYDGLDVAMTTGGEALISLVGGKAVAGIVDKLSPVVKKAYTKITGKPANDTLLSANAEPSEELLSALEKEGIQYSDLVNGSGVFEDIKTLLKATPKASDPEQAVRAARYDALGIKPVKASVTQSFEDAFESQTLRRQLNDQDASQLRQALADESEGFTQALSKISDSIGSGNLDEAGELVREALKSRKSAQRIEKSDAYKLLAEKSEQSGGSLPISVENIASEWNKTRGIKRSQMQALHSDVKESLMRFGVVEPDEAFSKLVAKGDEEIQPLTFKNFENLRQELNANINPQDPSTSAILRPLINKLDDQVDETAEMIAGAKPRVRATDADTPQTLEAKTAAMQGKLNDQGELVDLSKTARGKARAFKQEFESKNMVNDILGTKPGTFDTYKVRSQDIYKKLIKTSRKQPTYEQLNEVMTSLEKGGRKGERAIAQLQSATIMDILQEATSALSQKNMKGQQFSYTNFRKALNGIGDKELDRLFSNNPNSLTALRELDKAAADSQTFFDAIPKGSAADIQNMFVRSFGPLFEAVGFLKSGTLGRMAAETIIDGANNQVSKRELKKAVASQIKAKPELRKELTHISKQYPGVFEMLGISLAVTAADKAGETNKNSEGNK